MSGWFWSWPISPWKKRTVEALPTRHSSTHRRWKIPAACWRWIFAPSYCRICPAEREPVHGGWFIPRCWTVIPFAICTKKTQEVQSPALFVIKDVKDHVRKSANHPSSSWTLVAFCLWFLSIDWSVDGLIDRLIDWLIDWCSHFFYGLFIAGLLVVLIF